ncbi:hypothetical protein COR50_05540 [Chitinophaga caeni]|uniref:PNPLA domain-containing protein n=1 Tax=Chitinophaga caeni TaxID=2029983 RepID=A0A291QRY7_9BACT|nr:hypothetical protein COR50_05540 [Chitinophaga caeni]
MKYFIFKIYYSFPIQLLLLHFRKYQILLIFWVILFSTINGGFAKLFGGDSLFLAPEYLGKVSFYSTAILGVALAVFTMSWNITTFILHSGRFKFLATTTQPFFRYCLNNMIIPALFLGDMIFRLWRYQLYQELNMVPNVLLLTEGFVAGYLLIIFISFFYFFNADKNIGKRLNRQFGTTRNFLRLIIKPTQEPDENALPVDNYFSTPWRIRRARNVDHYNKHYLDNIFKQHHVAAMITIGLALVFLVILAYLMDYNAFRIPAGASVLIFFAFLIGIAGAYSYLLQTWSIPFLLVILIGLNWMVKHDMVDNRNKGYGLNYLNKNERPVYDVEHLQSFFSEERSYRDQASTIQILQRWRSKFPENIKPKLVILNVSGGGTRSATWTMNVLQRLDSLLEGRLMTHTVLMTGASGGMMGATYFRELYLQQLQGKVHNIYDSTYREKISSDILNAVFASLAVNDLITPFRNFKIGNNRYTKDRGYAFEMQLNKNTDYILDKPISAYQEPEAKADIPLLIWNGAINADGRKLIISAQPISYLCAPQYLHPTRPWRDIDGIDFQQFFSKQSAGQLKVTSAIRMNATFPYVLPNVFLPSKPIIDVMDAGIRDNFGQETSLRFLYTFRDWINANTGGVLFIQIRDTRKNNMQRIKGYKDLSDLLFEPLFTMQQHWSTMQDYTQDYMINYMEGYFPNKFERVIFQYVPQQSNQAAALSFHLTSREKRDIAEALKNPAIQNAFKYIEKSMEQQP